MSLLQRHTAAVIINRKCLLLLRTVVPPWRMFPCRLDFHMSQNSHFYALPRPRLLGPALALLSCCPGCHQVHLDFQPQQSTLEFKQHRLVKRYEVLVKSHTKTCICIWKNLFQLYYLHTCYKTCEKVLGVKYM